MENEKISYQNIKGQYKPLCKEEEDRLIAMAKDSKEARDTLVINNFGLVMSIANNYSKYMNFDDLVNEGVLGLIKAIKSYDPTKNTQLGSYATFWIRKEILIAINKNSKIHLPRNLITSLKIFKEALKEGKDYEVAAKKAKISKKVAFGMLSLSETPMSLEYFIADRGIDAIRYDEKFDNVLDKLAVEQILDSANLTPSELEIIDYYFGLSGVKLTVQAIADINGISRQGANQKLKRALAKIKSNLEYEEIKINKVI